MILSSTRIRIDDVNRTEEEPGQKRDEPRAGGPPGAAV
jgi:hypothetical protein